MLFRLKPLFFPWHLVRWDPAIPTAWKAARLFTLLQSFRTEIDGRDGVARSGAWWHPVLCTQTLARTRQPQPLVPHQLLWISARSGLLVPQYYFSYTKKIHKNIYLYTHIYICTHIDIYVYVCIYIIIKSGLLDVWLNNKPKKIFIFFSLVSMENSTPKSLVGYQYPHTPNEMHNMKTYIIRSNFPWLIIASG